MIKRFQRSEKRNNGGVKVCGHDATTANFDVNSIDHPGTIYQRSRSIVGFSIGAGMLSLDNVVHFKHAPMIVEHVLVSNAAACLNTGDNNAASPVVDSTPG